MSTRSASAAALAPARSTELAERVADYKELLKPGIAGFVVVMAAASYVLATRGAVDWWVLLGLMGGTGLTAGGAGALNHLVERRFDALMPRTAARPLAAGRLQAGPAAAYALACAAAGALLLATTTNALTTGLAVLTVVLYVAVYTPLKRRTVHNTLVGAVPGALPALGGVTAATGSLDATGLALFAILYLWQLPHFYALAWMYRADYLQGGFRMLPSGTRSDAHGQRAVRRLVLGATLALLVAGVVPTAIGSAGVLYLVGVSAIGTAFTIPAFSFFAEPTDERARRLLLASIAYVPAFFVLVVLDTLLR